MASGRLVSVVTLAALLLIALSAQAATDQKRVALVIGNASYPSAPLANPVNDATDMAALLEKLGFEVILERDAGKRKMEGAVKTFYRQLQGSKGIALFYYAGHGLQMRGQNYLVPVDAEIESEGDVDYRTVQAGWVLSKMEDAGNPVNIVILDACRNNPFTRGFRSGERGLAQMPSPTGSIIAYATAPGQVASDGEGRNGLYTRHLLRYLPTPGLGIQDVFTQVGADVYTESGKKQTPWISSSLMGKISLATATLTIATSPSAPVGNDALKAEKERLERQKRELEALKAQIEADKRRAEEERRLAEDRARIAAERKRLEEEKQNLLAMVTPTPYLQKDQNSIKNQDKYRLGILKPKNPDRSFDRRFLRTIEEALISSKYNIRIAMSFSSDGFTQEENINTSITDDSTIDELWTRKSLFSNFEPNLDFIKDNSKKYNSNIFILYNFMAPTSYSIENGWITIYLISPEADKIYKDTQKFNRTSLNYQTDDNIKMIINNLIESFFIDSNNSAKM